MAAKKRTTRRRPAPAPIRARTAAARARAKQRRKARPARKSGAQASAAAGGPRVHLKVGERDIVATIEGSAQVSAVAAEWMYILRNRHRWMHDEALRASLQSRARESLADIGIDDARLLRLVVSRHIEVAFEGTVSAAVAPPTDAQEGLVAMPWEYLISVATRDVGRTQPVLITRLLEVPGTKPSPQRQVKKVLFMESAPGRVADLYDFESEKERIRAALGLESSLFGVLRSDEFSSFAGEVARFAPDVLHISGVDNHQAPSLLGEPFEALVGRLAEGATTRRESVPHVSKPEDGMLVCGSVVPEVPIAAHQLASGLLGANETSPIVTMNLYFSGCRIASEFIRQGASAALGFFDQVDDEVAENFFQQLFWELRSSPRIGDLPLAFDRAWSELRDAGVELHGTGIVLWTAFSIFPALPRMVAEQSSAKRLATPARPTSEERASRRAAQRQRSVLELLQVEAEVPKTVNYSLLHNERPLLQKLTLTKLIDGALDDLSVLVELNVGGERTYPYRCTVPELAQPQLALADKIVIPLTADLPRSLRELLHTTVYIRVTCAGAVAHEETHRVRLLPVDQWKDDTANNPWLPSFVLPRDPAVARIISAARRYLVTLSDDPNAGFDGYQNVDPEEADSLALLDAQVQAIWTAIVQEYRLLYVNPPPAYAETDQRLRTPSEILATSSGTCIDLALLLASCLEYVDIFPVVVLLSGHAFVGYWRAQEYHDEFHELGELPARLPVQVAAMKTSYAVPLVDRYHWRLAEQQFAEIRLHARKDKLRFLEATGLCFGYSFAEALEEGSANLGSRSDFDSMLDIRLARLADPPVTPLPILSSSEEAGR